MNPIKQLIINALRNRSRTNVRTLLNDALRANTNPRVEKELLRMLSEADYKVFDEESSEDFLMFNYNLRHLFAIILTEYPNLPIPKLLQVADAMSGGKVDIKDYLAVLRMLDQDKLKELFENSAFVVSEEGIVKWWNQI